MINWTRTEAELGYTEKSKIPKKQKIICNCDVCSKEVNITKTHHYMCTYRAGLYRCHECGKKQMIAGVSRSIKKKWGEKDYRQKQESRRHTDELKIEAKQRSLKLWKNEWYVNKFKSGFDPEKAKQNLAKGRDKALNILSTKLKKLWKDDEYKTTMCNQSKELWKNKTYRQSITDKLQNRFSSKSLLELYSKRSKELWKDDRYRTRVVEGLKRKWNTDETFRKRMTIINNTRSNISNIQKILYSTLDDFGVNYQREYEDRSETTIGYYNFDCIIPRNNKPDLLIECQGDYWHSKEQVIARDKSKATYIEKYFSDQYELKYLWEHEFYCKDRITELLKYWLGISEQDKIEYDLNSIKIIYPCEAKDYKLLLNKYHYLPNAGRGGKAYGAYLNEELIAVCVFSPLSRQNIRTNGYDYSECLELSRFCIHPRYQKKNLGSWMISRCLKLLDKKYKLIISYCDTTYNHDGTLYKSCNFKQDGIVKPDYWYIDQNNYVMHKKTLYNRAVKMGMKEKEFADMYSYKKIFGNEKLRFIFKT